MIAPGRCRRRRRPESYRAVDAVSRHCPLMGRRVERSRSPYILLDGRAHPYLRYRWPVDYDSINFFSPSLYNTATNMAMSFYILFSQLLVIFYGLL